MEDFQEPKALDIQASKLEARPRQRFPVSLNTVRARDALTPRPGIYWQKTGSGRAVGFKKQNADVGQTWHVQIYDPVTRKQVRRSLGTLDEIAGNRQFDEAAKQLTKLIDELKASKSVPSETVKSVCEAYVRKAADAGEAQKALDLKSRFVRLVYKDPLGSIELRQLTKVDVEGWRKRLVDRAALVNPRAKKPRYRTRSKSAVNRDMTAIRAALNFAKESDVIESDKAWKLALKPFKSVGGRRELYLTRAQRQAWIEKCAPEARPLLVGLSLLPLRPGALALLTVKAFQEALNVLTVGKDKTGGDRKMRVPPVTSKHLAEAQKGKTRDDPLFARGDGRAWDKKTWNTAFKLGAALAELPKECVAYTMRHSVITDLVMTGVPILIVAKLSGTSVKMIEQHYGHLQAEDSEAALATLAKVFPPSPQGDD